MERICEFLQIPLMLSVATAYSSHTSHDIIPLPWPSNRILSNTRLGRLNPLVSGQPAANECLLEASELGSIWCWHRGHRHRSKVKWSEVEVAQSYPTLCDPMNYTVHGILQARTLQWVAFPFSRGSTQPGIEPRSPVLQEDSLPAEPQGETRQTQRLHPISMEHWTKLCVKTGAWGTCWSYWVTYEKGKKTVNCHSSKSISPLQTAGPGNALTNKMQWGWSSRISEP